MNNDYIALMLLELSKKSDDSNEFIKNISFKYVIDINIYINKDTTINDSDSIYCVYADFYDESDSTTSTAEFYFLVTQGNYFNEVQYIEVRFLHIANLH